MLGHNVHKNRLISQLLWIITTILVKVYQTLSAFERWKQFTVRGCKCQLNICTWWKIIGRWRDQLNIYTSINTTIYLLHNLICAVHNELQIVVEHCKCAKLMIPRYYVIIQGEMYCSTELLLTYNTQSIFNFVNIWGTNTWLNVTVVGVKEDVCYGKIWLVQDSLFLENW